MNNVKIEFPKANEAVVSGRIGRGVVAIQPNGHYSANVTFSSGAGYADEVHQNFKNAVLWTVAVLANLG